MDTAAATSTSLVTGLRSRLAQPDAAAPQGGASGSDGVCSTAEDHGGMWGDAVRQAQQDVALALSPVTAALTMQLAQVGCVAWSSKVSIDVNV